MADPEDKTAVIGAAARREPRPRTIEEPTRVDRPAARADTGEPSAAYRVLTGYAPFASREIAETLYRVVHTRPMRPSLLAPELHPDVDLVLAIGMASRAADRFSTGAELAEALRDALAGSLAPITRARAAALLQVAGWSSSLARPQRAH